MLIRFIPAEWAQQDPQLSPWFLTLLITPLSLQSIERGKLLTVLIIVGKTLAPVVGLLELLVPFITRLFSLSVKSAN